MLSGLENIDLVEILFTLFWVFFIGLVLYLHRESKREGYPLSSDRSEHVVVQGFPSIPAPKEYHLPDGRVVLSPREEAPEEPALEAAAPHPGAPFNPTGDPMLTGVGSGAWCNRPDTAELTLEGNPRIVPMRSDEKLHVDEQDLDPRGLPVVAADGEEVGTVKDLWIDLAEPQIYFLEVSMSDDGRAVLVPFGFAEIDKGAQVIRVNVIYSHQFANVPLLKSPDQVTLLEEDKIMGYFGGGLLFADKERAEPWI